MPSESDHHIEALLKACAQKRREAIGGPFKLHPATRQLLQSEVTRTFGHKGWTQRYAFSWLTQGWRRLAFGGGLCAALAWAVFVILRPPSITPDTVKLAKSEAASPVPAPSARPGTTTSPLPLSKDESADARKAGTSPAPGLAGNKAISESTPSVDNSRQFAFEESSRGGGRLSEADRTVRANPEKPTAMAPMGPAPTEAPPPAPLALESTPAPKRGQLANAPALASPQMANSTSALVATAPAASFGADARSRSTPSASPASARPAAETAEVKDLSRENKLFLQLRDATPGIRPMLAAFDFEKAGNQVKIVDSDGSTYEGQILSSALRPMAGGGRGSSLLMKTAANSLDFKSDDIANTASNVTASTAPYYYFRASGTNRSLNQRVEINGQLLSNSLAGAPFPGIAQPALVRRSLADSHSAPRESRISTWLIKGQAIIGGTNQVPINAVTTGSGPVSE